MKSKIENLFVQISFKFKQALEKLDETAQGVLLLIDDSGRLIRTVTDGDIRRLLLKDYSLDSTLSVLPINESKFLPQSATIQEAFHLMEKYELDHIPFLDDSGKPVRLIHRRELPSTILLSTPHMGEQEQHFVTEAFNTNWVAPLGPNVDAFENEMAAYLNIKAAVALSSGTAALHLALVLLGVKTDDLVFCSTFTFVATANAILYQAAKPVFIDSELESWNMSPDALERALKEAAANNQLPKAVIIVNLYGQSAKYDELCKLCEQYNVPIIEDAAESLGATYNGKFSGTFGKLGVFSFNGNKIITTSGGGMLVSEDASLIERARFLATQARDPAPHYEHSVIGYNYRMSNVLAGIGRGQLMVLEERVAARQAIYNRYQEALNSYQATKMMPKIPNGRSTHWLSTMLLDPQHTSFKPMDIIKKLSEFRIEARRTWKPMHMQPLFADAKYYSHSENFSVSNFLFEQGICLPSGSNLSPGDIDWVIKSLITILDHKECLTKVN